MAIELSLDAVDERAQEDYADIIIPLPGEDPVTLVHPLRMDDEKREAFEEYFKGVQERAKATRKAREAAEKAGEDPDEAEEALEGPAKSTSERRAESIRDAKEMLSIIAAGDDAERLFEQIGDDLLKYQTIAGFYFETVNPGEA